MSGVFGDALIRTTIGGWIAYAVIVLPLVGLVTSLVWLIAAAVIRKIPG